jgi:2-methylisocitrate lyase-like PEP mutase family enzyme
LRHGAELRRRFRELHEAGIFVMPNPWDVGAARILASLGFPALATTSSGHAATLGRPDQHVTREELLAHAAAIAAAADVPVNVDAERCFASDARGVADPAQLIAETGASGFR